MEETEATFKIETKELQKLRRKKAYNQKQRISKNTCISRHCFTLVHDTPTISPSNSSYNISTTDTLNTKNEIEMNAENVLISAPTTDTLNTDNENNNQIEMNTENISISNISKIPSIKEYLNTMKSSSLLPVSFDQHLTTKIIQDRFNDFM